MLAGVAFEVPFKLLKASIVNEVVGNSNWAGGFGGLGLGFYYEAQMGEV